MLWKILVRPLITSLDALLDRLHWQIKNGQAEQALSTIEELRAAITEVRKWL